MCSMFKGGTSVTFATRQTGDAETSAFSLLVKLPGFASGKQGWASLSDVRPSLPAFQSGAATR